MWQLALDYIFTGSVTYYFFVFMNLFRSEPGDDFTHL